MKSFAKEGTLDPQRRRGAEILLKLHTRNLKLIFCVLFVLCGGALGLDRNAFTFTEYRLQAQIDPPTHSFSAGGTVTLRNDSEVPQKNAVLQISSSLGWQEITLDHKKVLYVSHPYESDVDHTGFLNEAVVTLPQAVAPHATVQLEILYGGTIEVDTARLEQLGTPKDISANNDWDQISPEFTAVRGVGYVAWYPIAMDAFSLSDGPEYGEALGHWRDRSAGSKLDVKISVAAEKEAPDLTFISNGETVGSASPTAFVTLGTGAEFEFKGAATPLFVIGKYQSLDGALRVAYL